MSVSKNDNGDVSCRVVEVAAEIRMYMHLHPQAKDTVEGIAGWWVREETDVVRHALDLLVRQGLCRKARDLYSSSTCR